MVVSVIFSFESDLSSYFFSPMSNDITQVMPLATNTRRTKGTLMKPGVRKNLIMIGLEKWIRKVLQPLQWKSQTGKSV